MNAAGNEWILAWAHLTSLRENLPPYWNENEVMKYNGILTELEGVSGADLSTFRVADNELQSVSLYEALDGEISHKERCCDDHVIRQKMEGAFKYFEYLQRQSRPVKYGF